MNVDEMVIASCLLIAGLEGCVRMACAAKLFALHLSLLFLILSARFDFGDNCRRSVERTKDESIIIQ